MGLGLGLSRRASYSARLIRRCFSPGLARDRQSRSCPSAQAVRLARAARNRRESQAINRLAKEQRPMNGAWTRTIATRAPSPTVVFRWGGPGWGSPWPERSPAPANSPYSPSYTAGLIRRCLSLGLARDRRPARSMFTSPGRPPARAARDRRGIQAINRLAKEQRPMNGAWARIIETRPSYSAGLIRRSFALAFMPGIAGPIHSDRPSDRLKP